MRIGIAVTLLVLATSAATAQRPYHPDTAALQRLLVAEDNRGKGADGIAPMMTALHGSDTLLRRVAVRAMGRLQRPVFARLIADQLSDPVPAIRAETANAIAQSEVNIKRRAADSGQGEGAVDLGGAPARPRHRNRSLPSLMPSPSRWVGCRSATPPPRRPR